MLLLSISFLERRNECQNDTIPPMNIPPLDLILSNDAGACSATISPAILGYPVTFDQCGVISALPSNVPAGYAFPVGETIVTWIVTDASGNSTTSTQSVIVIDNEEPQITCASNISVQTIPGECDALVNVPIPNATDNCSIISIVNE